MNESRSTVRSKRLRRYSLFGGVPLLLVAVACALWFWLPAVAPGWVIRNSPWVSPVVRSVRSADQPLEAFIERIDQWGPEALPGLASMMRESQGPELWWAMIGFRRVFGSRLLGLEWQMPDPPPTVCGISEAEPYVDALVAAATSPGMPYDSDYEYETHSQARQIALDTLCAIPSERAFEALIHLLNAPDVGLRCGVAERLGELRSPQAVPALVAQLADANPLVRLNVAAALARFGDERALAPLLSLLGSEDGSTRGNAAAALGVLGKQSAIEPLLALIRNPDEYVRYKVAGALGRLGARQAIGPLKALLNDGNQPVRNEAALALKQIEQRSPTDAGSPDDTSAGGK